MHPKKTQISGHPWHGSRLRTAWKFCPVSDLINLKERSVGIHGMALGLEPHWKFCPVSDLYLKDIFSMTFVHHVPSVALLFSL